MSYRIGVDIGGMSIKVALVSSNGDISNKAVKVTPLNSNENLTNCVFELISEVLTSAKLTASDIDGIGIGSPGIINAVQGEIVYASNLGIEHLKLCELVTKKFNIKCYIENDANCAVLGEYYFGNAKGNKNVVMITLGTGVGTGFIINGKLLVSSQGGGTEGGHIIVMIDGEKCACGEKGCYEKYASASALISLTKQAIKNYPESKLQQYATSEGEVNGKVVFMAVNDGDKVARQVLDKYITYVSSGIISVVNIFRPEVVLIGGGLSQQKELLIDPINEYVNEHMFGHKYLSKVEVKQAKLKNDAGILGAAMLGIND